MENSTQFADWISRVIESENETCGQLDFVFCSDDYLLEINRKFLDHDTFTDIISFDYSDGRHLSGDIFISVDRVRENAKVYETGLTEELLRVMAHGVLHLLGYNDKTISERKKMRAKENDKMELFHVEQ